MGLDPGARLSHYEIVELIGKGGMGEVYRAHDSKLGRDVAIKVLPEELSRDEERLRRFEREAKVLASLNHTNIGAIYGFEQSGSTHHLVLELVEGETLAERIARGAMAVDEALPIASKIAEALEEAHERGVIHRDLKPANIKITPRDEVKVLDFGLAKAFAEESQEADSSMSPTITRDATRVGVILGTAAYMSPEQAKGKRVDKRTDIFAFGSVLYEMLTGKKAFPGDDVSEVLAAVIKLEPVWDALPPLPPRTRELLERCLEKDTKRRRRDIGDVLNDLTRADLDSAGDPRASPNVAWWPAVLSAAAAASIAGLVVWSVRSTPPSDPVVVRFESLMEAGTMGPAARQAIAISRDGRRFAYSASEGGLYIRELDELNDRVLPGTTGFRAPEPFFSPDGEWIGFHENGRLQKASLRGGEPVTICEADAPNGVSWGDDGTIVFGQGQRIYRVSGDGGAPQVVVDVDGASGETADGPLVLPGGATLLYTLRRGSGADASEIVAHSLGDGASKTLVSRAHDVHYVPPGYLVFGSGSTLMVARFDAGHVEILGTPVPAAHDVGGSAPMRYAVSATGTLIYVRQNRQETTAAWVDRSGATLPLSMPERTYQLPRISPDGRWVAAIIDDDVWAYEIDRDLWSRVTSTEDVTRVEWSRDSRTIVFSSSRNGVENLYRQAIDATGLAEQLTAGTVNQHPDSVSPDGRTLYFHEHAGRGFTDLWRLPLDGDREPKPLLQTDFNDRIAKISPRGDWLAYTSDETGNISIYLRRDDGMGEKALVSPGFAPVWSPDGRELFFVHEGDLHVVEISGESSLRVGSPRLVLDGSNFWLRAGPLPNFDITPDGTRFFMLRGDGGFPSPRMQVVVNWTAELERLLSPNDD